MVALSILITIQTCYTSFDEGPRNCGGRYRSSAPGKISEARVHASTTERSTYALQYQLNFFEKRSNYTLDAEYGKNRRPITPL